LVCVEGFFQSLVSNIEYPFVRARLYVNGELKGELFLLVDTGAGITSLSYKDVVRLGLSNVVQRGPRRKVVGVSGTAHERVLEGNIELELFDNTNTLRVQLSAMTLAEMPRQRDRDFNLALQRPSILGSDALRNMVVTVDYSKKVVRLCLCEETETAQQC
jgi:hypothetical protein